MIAAQRVEKVNSMVNEAKKIAEEVPNVEVVIGGETVGLAEKQLARAVAMAIKFKRIADEVEEQLSRYKEEIKALVKEEGIAIRPVRFRIRGVGEVVVSAKDPSVKILNPKELYEVLKDKFFKMVSFKAKKSLVEIACDADSEEGKKVREYLLVNMEQDDTVRVTAKKQ